jgi:hypothetical protein
VRGGELPQEAFEQARQTLRHSWRRWLDPKATADTLKFKFYGGQHDQVTGTV